jgi:hypothetical protein
MPTKRIKPKPVTIEWLDAAGRSEWRNLADTLGDQPLPCMSSGTILHRDKKRIVVAQTCSLDADGYIDSVSDVMTIPAPWVRRVRRK